MGCWLFIQWPGHFIYDTFALMNTLAEGQYSGWHSYVYSFYVKPFFVLNKDLSLLGLFQICFFSLIASYIWTWLIAHGCKKIIVWACTLFFLISPIHYVMSIFYNRDPLHAWLNILLGFLMFTIFLEGTSQCKKYMFIIVSFLTCILAELRQDSIVLVPTVLLVFFFIFDKKIDFIKWVVVPLLTLFIVINKVIPTFIHADNMSAVYGLTAIINPMGALLKEGNRDQLTTKDIEAVEKVAKIEDFIEQHTGLEINLFHKGLANLNPSESEFKDFIKVYFKLILENPLIFLKNRWHLFLIALGVHPSEKPMYFADSLHPDELERSTFMQESASRHGISKVPRFGIFQRAHYVIYTMIYPLRVIFSSGGIGFILLVVSLLFFKRLPATACFSAIILCRVAIVFLAAPAPQFKYLYAVMLASYFIIPLAYCEFRLRYAQSD